MGTSMEGVQNAYRGFSRGNFTMLDNLALGFAGTKEGMQELLDKAQELSGIKYDIGSYADIVQAIHVVQESMGIAGTTSEEAAGTISGSLASIQAAWQNLVTGFANKDADIGQLIENLIVPATNVLNNMLPVVEQAIAGIATFIEKALPAVMERVPVLLNDTLPSLINAAINALKVIVDALVNNASIIAESASSLITQLIEGIAEMAPKLIEAAVVIITTLANGLADALPELVPAVVQAVLTIVQTLLDHQNEMMLAAIALIQGLAEGLVNYLPIIIDALPQIIQSIVTNLIMLAPELLIAAIEILAQLAIGLVSSLGIVLIKIPEIIAALVNGFLEAGKEFEQVGGNMMTGLWEGIKSRFAWVKEQFKNAIGDLVSLAKNVLGIHSPSRVFAGIGDYMVQGLGEGWEKGIGDIKERIGKDLDFESNMSIVSNTKSGAAVSPYQTATGGTTNGNGDIVIPVYIGGENIDTIIVNAQRRMAYRSGGMTYA